MSRKLAVVSKSNNESVLGFSKIGGFSVITQEIEWPKNPDGLDLTLILTIPCSIINQAIGADLDKDSVVSVFTTYDKSDYFLDKITFSGDQAEYQGVLSGYTKVIIHKKGPERIDAKLNLPELVMNFGESCSDDFGGSKLGGKPILLQNFEIGKFDIGEFCLQIYGGDFPEGYEDIFYLSDSMGYLYINTNDPAESMFFTQCT